MSIAVLQTIQQHIVNMTEDISKIRDKLAQLMEVQPLLVYCLSPCL